jgi:prepilin signal peptidase PulO-like enzyme (type II secretory pathway)
VEEMLFLFVVTLVLFSFFVAGDKVPERWRYILYGAGVIVLIVWLVKLSMLRGD